MLALWGEAVESDGGGSEPRAHRLVLDAMKPDDELRREQSVEDVARVDLDPEAVPALVGWIRERVETGKSVDAWVRALRPGCGVRFGFRAVSGAPMLLRALCERPETQGLAIDLLAGLDKGAVTTEAVLEHADRIEERLAEDAWRRRRVAKMTADDARAGNEGSGGG